MLCVRCANHLSANRYLCSISEVGYVNFHKTAWERKTKSIDFSPFRIVCEYVLPLVITCNNLKRKWVLCTSTEPPIRIFTSFVAVNLDYLTRFVPMRSILYTFSNVTEKISFFIVVGFRVSVFGWYSYQFRYFSWLFEKRITGLPPPQRWLWQWKKYILEEIML